MVNFALIGCGKIAIRHAEAIQQTAGATLLAVCDQDETRAAEMGARAQVAHYADYATMLKAHPTIDVVTLLTPTGLHAEQALTIMQDYQKHLLIEKPMVLTLKQAKQLEACAAKQGVHIFPVYQHRFNHAVQRVKQGLDNPHALGALRVGTVRVRWCRPQRYYDMSAWRGTWAMDGGALTNQGIHFLDLLRYLCGDVYRVHAKLATLGAQIEVEDTAVAILEFKNGAVGVIEVMTSARPDDFEASISCVCEKGLAVIGGMATNQLQVYTPDPSAVVTHSEIFENGYGNGHNAIIAGVVATLATGSSPPIDFADGMATIQLLHALYQSDEQDQWVVVADAGDSARLGQVPAPLYHIA